MIYYTFIFIIVFLFFVAFFIFLEYANMKQTVANTPKIFLKHWTQTGVKHGYFITYFDKYLTIDLLDLDDYLFDDRTFHKYMYDSYYEKIKLSYEFIENRIDQLYNTPYYTTFEKKFVNGVTVRFENYNYLTFKTKGDYHNDDYHACFDRKQLTQIQKNIRFITKYNRIMTK